MVPTTVVVASAENFPEHRAAGTAHKTRAPHWAELALLVVLGRVGKVLNLWHQPSHLKRGY